MLLTSLVAAVRVEERHPGSRRKEGLQGEPARQSCRAGSLELKADLPPD